jgi:hypothetical protein
VIIVCVIKNDEIESNAKFCFVLGILLSSGIGAIIWELSGKCLRFLLVDFMRDPKRRYLCSMLVSS